MSDITIDFTTEKPGQRMIRVIGLNRHSKTAIDKINRLRCEGVTASVEENANMLFPKNDDYAVIFITDNQECLPLIRTFHQAGIVTIVIASEEYEWDDRSTDAFTTVPPEQTAETVKVLLSPFRPETTNISLSLLEWRYLLKDAGRFALYEAGCHRGENGIAEACELICLQINGLKFDKMLISVTYNPENPVTLKEIEPLNNLFATIPEDISTRFALTGDKELEKERLKISVVVTGTVR